MENASSQIDTEIPAANDIQDLTSISYSKSSHMRCPKDQYAYEVHWPSQGDVVTPNEL